MSAAPQGFTGNNYVRQAFADELARKGYHPHLGVTKDALEAFDAAQRFVDAAQASLEPALRDAFAHFQNDEPVTPEAIKAIGREFQDMVMGWEPQKTEMEFADHEGKIRKIVYEPGDYETGIHSGWVLDDDGSLDPAYAAWQPIETAPREWLSPILAWNSRQPTWPPVVVRWDPNGNEEVDGEPHWCDAATRAGDALYFNQNFFDLWMPCPSTSIPSTEGK